MISFLLISFFFFCYSKTEITFERRCIYFTVSYHTIPDQTVLYHTIQNQSIPYHTKPYSTLPFHSITYKTIPYRTIPDPSLPYHTIPKEQVFLCEKKHPYNTTFYPLLHKQETSISIKTPMHKCKAHVVLFKVFLCVLYLFYSNFYSVL